MTRFTSAVKLSGIVFLIAAIHYSGFGAESEGPAWVSRKPADPGYFYGIGKAEFTAGSRADARLSADRRAVDDLLMDISRSVADSIRNTYEEIRDKEERAVEEFSRTTTLNSASDLDNIEFLARYDNESEKTAYTLVRLAGDEVLKSYERKSRQTRDRCRDLTVEARKAAGEGNIQQAVTEYIDILNEILLIQAVTGRTLTGDPLDTGFESGLQSFFSNQLTELARNLNIEILSGDNQETKLGEGLRNNILGRIRFENIPVFHFPLTVSFLNASGQVDQDSLFSDSDGQFSVRVARVDSAFSGRAQILISCPSPLPRQWHQPLNSVERAFDGVRATVAFTVASRAGSRLFIHIYEMENDQILAQSRTQLQMEKAALAQDLSILDYSRIQSIRMEDLNAVIDYEDWDGLFASLDGLADVALLGSVTASPDPATGSGHVFALASARLTLLDIREQQLISTIRLNDIEGEGLTPTEAMNSALEKCRKELIPQILEGLNRDFC